MKKNIYLLGVFCLFLAVYACSDDIANEVYQKPEAPITTKKASLTVLLENSEEGRNYVIGVLTRNPFDEQGKSEEMTEGGFVFQKTVQNGQVIFNDLMDHYKNTLYFNVYEKEGSNYRLLSHLGNQLQYQVTFGDIKKTIDLKATRPEVLKKTVVDVTLDGGYNNKVLYLVKSIQQKKMEERLKTGTAISEDMYVATTVSAEGKGQIVFNTPLNEDSYWVYLKAPAAGIPYLKREINISYETEKVSCDFPKELPKQINITVIRDKKKLNNQEVYLIAEENWIKVKQQVEINHGNPQEGTYVEMKRTVNGAVSFEQFCLEGEQKYVIFVPKWRTEYYDSYERGQVTLTPEVNDYTIAIGDMPAVTKTVDFTVSLNLPPGTMLGYGALAYVLDDSANLSTTMSNLASGYPTTGLYHSTEEAQLATSVEVRGVEIDTSKEFVVFVYPIGGWPMKIAVKRINPSDIVGTNMKITLTELENAFSF